eukprot:6563290-Prymnesium_polylepis.1
MVSAVDQDEHVLVHHVVLRHALAVSSTRRRAMPPRASADFRSRSARARRYGQPRCGSRKGSQNEERHSRADLCAARPALPFAHRD